MICIKLTGHNVTPKDTKDRAMTTKEQTEWKSSQLTPTDMYQFI